MAKKLTKTKSVEWKYNFNDELRKKFSKPDWSGAVQKIIDQTIVPLIKKGISPVSGIRKYAPYKGVAGAKEHISANKISTKGMNADQKKTARLKNEATSEHARKGVYPYSVMDYYPDKKVSPANLTLSGEMLSYYRARPAKEPVTIELGIFKDSTPEEVVKRAIQNNFGTKDVPARPFIPVEYQQFTTKITLEIRQAFADALKKALKR